MLLDFLDASAGYCFSFGTCNWRKAECCFFPLFCDYSTAGSAVIGTKHPFSISILNFLHTDSVYCISCLTFVQASSGRSVIGAKPNSGTNNISLWGLISASALYAISFSRPWSYELRFRPVQSTQFWSSLLQMLLIAFHF